jgi:glyoxylase-like metal-dependent hydrolase (beta-lactamase superfamily II)
MNEILEKVLEEFPKIKFIEGEREGRYPFSNSLLVGDFLIDTGISTRYIRKIRRTNSINNVILSHWHEDHISGNRVLKDVQFYAHEKDKPIIERIEKMFKYYGLVGKPIEEMFQQLIEVNGIQDTKVNSLISDGTVFNINKGLELEVLHTPGHTAGHCCFIERNSKIAFFSDIDLTSFPFYGSTDASVIDFLKSIEKLMNIDIHFCTSSHRRILKGKSNIREGLEKYKDIILSRENHILSYISEVHPKTSKDLF